MRGAVFHHEVSSWFCLTVGLLIELFSEGRTMDCNSNCQWQQMGIYYMCFMQPFTHFAIEHFSCFECKLRGGHANDSLEN